jgi:hypothetical protein
MKRIECVRLESGAHGNSLVARFANRDEAEKAKTLAAGYGPNIQDEVITIYDTAIEFEPKLDAASRESGLAKLSHEEKLALGLASTA